MTRNACQIFGSFVFGLPDIIKALHLYVVSSEETVSIVLRQLAY